jgi:predicted Rossmann-fold nucleotide-binding protein
MKFLEHIMELYEEALEELMDAQKYAKLAEHTEHPDERQMYHNLAKQELEHEAMIVSTADREVMNVADGEKETMRTVWHHLKKHLHSWREDIEHKIK